MDGRESKNWFKFDKICQAWDVIPYKEVKKTLKPAKVVLQSDLFSVLKNNPKSLTKISLHR